MEDSYLGGVEGYTGVVRVQKVWLLCRRKNLAMPRMMSWLINQSLYPVYIHGLT